MKSKLLHSMQLIAFAMAITMSVTVQAQTQTVNLSNKIELALNVRSGEQIKMTVYTRFPNTPIRIVSGSNTLDTLIGTNLTNLVYTPNHNSMTIYGNLQYLSCGSNGGKITAIDASSVHTTLEVLYCFQNAITSLDVSGLINLEHLDCGYNALTSLDISGLTNMTHFDCRYNTTLTSLNVGKQTRLKYFYCSNTALTSLDISGLINVYEVKCANSALTSLNTGNNKRFEHFDCSNNALTSLDVSGCKNLKYLSCQNNALTSLDVSECKNLRNLSCQNNALNAIDITGTSSALKTINCYGNQFDACTLDELFRSLPVVNGGNIYVINGATTNPGAGGCRHQIAENKGWQVPGISNTAFACINPNINNKIAIAVQNGQQIQLNLRAVADNTPIRILNGSNTQDITVGSSWTGVQTYTAVGDTIAVYGDINGLDCSGNGNKIVAVNFSQQHTTLKELNCSNNALTSLNVSGLTALGEFNCSNNAIASLNVSGVAALKAVHCYGNQLDACSIDIVLRSLPIIGSREPDALIFIKDGVATNSGADNCRTPIATSKKWKVMNLNGNASNATEITNNTFACNDVDTTKRIIYGATNGNGERSLLRFKAAAMGTPVRIESGRFIYEISVDTTWTDFQSYLLPTYSNVSIFGNITGFDCSDNGDKVTSFKSNSNNTSLTELYCSGNAISLLSLNGLTSLVKLHCDNNSLGELNIRGLRSLTELYCSGNAITLLQLDSTSAPKTIHCYGNKFDACALDALFRSMPQLPTGNDTRLYIKNGIETNPGSDNCRTSIATAKNWRIMDYNGNPASATDIANTNFACDDVNLNNKVVLIVRNGEKIKMRFSAPTNTPIRIESGSNVYETNIGTKNIGNYWSDYLYFTAGNDTMTIYGNTSWVDCNSNGNKITALNSSGNTAVSILYCASNNITSINASGMTALEGLICHANNITSLDISGSSALKTIVCFQNQLDACSLDLLFLSLPQRQTGDNARIYIKNSAATNPGADGCRNMTATVKNWRVMDFNGSTANATDIVNTNFTCVPDTNNKVVLSVRNGESVQLNLKATKVNTPVRIISRTDTTNIWVGTDWTGFQNHTAANDTMTVYGKINGFDCSGNGNKVTAIDVSGNTVITELNCSNNTLTSLNVSNATALADVYCYGNMLDDCALDSLFRLLPQRQTSDNARIYIKDGTATNPGSNGCRTTIAMGKNWRVMDYNGNSANATDIINTNFTCPIGVGIDEVSVMVITLNPNPVTDVLQVRAEGEVFTIKVYNMYGIEVAQATKATHINLAHLPTGVYTVVVNTAEGIGRGKIVKK